MRFCAGSNQPPPVGLPSSFRLRISTSLVISQLDRDFRESLILSDLCTADGMPIIWIARLTGIPIKNRIAGSDIFDALKAEHSTAHPLKIFLFGGPEGVASGGFAGAEQPAQRALLCGMALSWVLLSRGDELG